MENVNWKAALISIAFVAFLVPFGLTATSSSQDPALGEGIVLVPAGTSGEYYAVGSVSGLAAAHNVPVKPGGPDFTMAFTAAVSLFNVTCPQGATLTAIITVADIPNAMSGIVPSVTPTRILFTFTQGALAASASASATDAKLIMNVTKDAPTDHPHTVEVRVSPPAVPSACNAPVGTNVVVGRAQHSFRTAVGPTDTTSPTSKTGNNTGGDGGGSPSVTLPAVLATTALIALIVRARRRGEE